MKPSVALASFKDVTRLCDAMAVATFSIGHVNLPFTAT